VTAIRRMAVFLLCSVMALFAFLSLCAAAGAAFIAGIILMLGAVA